MRIEVLETFRHNGWQYSKGDVMTVDDDIGKLACGHGWARDTDDVVETGQFTPGARAIQPENVRHDVGDSNG